MTPRSLVGSGDKIIPFTLPFFVIGLVVNVLFPAIFAVGGPPAVLKTVSVAVLIPGIAIWLWSVALIMIYVPRDKLITGGPYAMVKHPIYTSVALLVLPWAGFLLNSWLGVVVGAALYIGSRKYAPGEEELLAKTYGTAWNDYVRSVRIPWL